MPVMHIVLFVASILMFGISVAHLGLVMQEVTVDVIPVASARAEIILSVVQVRPFYITLKIDMIYLFFEWLSSSVCYRRPCTYMAVCILFVFGIDQLSYSSPRVWVIWSHNYFIVIVPLALMIASAGVYLSFHTKSIFPNFLLSA